MSLFILATLAAFFIKGLCGFANTLVFQSILSFGVNNASISPVELALGFPGNAILTWQNRKSLDPKVFGPLMALMLAGSVIAQVFNTLGAIPGNVFIFIIISMAGNALNFALNLLGCYVHDLRLQCLEYFNKFYEDGGRPFRPLMADTKYVDITK